MTGLPVPDQHPLSFTHAGEDPTVVAGDVLAIAVAQGDDGVEVGPTAAAVGDAMGIDVAEACAAVGMDGCAGATAIAAAGDGLDVSLVVVAGLGPPEDVTADSVRAAAAAATRVAVRKESLVVAMAGDVDLAPDVVARAVVEGTCLAHHAQRDYKTDEDVRALATVAIVAPDGSSNEAAVQAGIARGTISADATILARDLGNTPAVDKRPPALAARVQDLFADLDVEVEVWDQARLEQEGFGGHLAVAAGSDVEPRFVQLRYRPAGASQHLGLLGKGITFDSGGLSLKSPKGMEWMKIDMAGAATVIAVVRAAAQAGWAVNLTGLLCMAENMPSGSATRPGDVITMLGGTTVEVLNTDAEGRLVMADGLAWSANLELDALVDVATLTGSALHSVGPRYTALMANDDDLAEGLLAASVAAAEPMWRLPLARAEYGEDVKSDIADLRNVGGTAAGTIRAALFLDQFVPEGMSWGHLDIAGAAWNDTTPYNAYVPKAATGMPARTLVDWVASHAT